VGTPDDLTKAIKILKQPPKERPQHWQIHARRYEDRINSGCLERVAEVIRDLHLETRTESMRGRELYERAVTKLVEEAAVIWKLSKEDALKDLRERSGRRLHHPHFIVRQLSLPVETPPAVTADEEMAAVTVRPDDVLYYPDRQRSVSVYKSAEVVELDGERLDLRKTDFALFYLIYSKEGATISAAAIADELNMLVQTVSARISQLRTRLGYAQFVIKTTSDGYQFVFPNDDH
jgi:biotin operon repressor